ncbi:multidrug efflux MFS transporter periplasmic adaptor subunit EmrA [Brenneria goodwinii]|uniref:multidrug efflux MFS transporter periplasmic adaptor subunit EmrA n=1 Tax=Brenneria goodwinii TaxID=1109412 RepID=UPI000EF1DFF9|nr:multidrug efflux MFS transporter periplasmic adaptor subunit EmrA [Brenneria goodwinii]MCG8156464.1 multidrug efflux MFS transporter periplasmic adaptor subunit EmrA [Brenneria goodwinii]MCG8162165.1 multidrug efflux MFS transporter periplasmic adaptor subunit EmrA [Brenneria goodwinii]MCG8166793.1 multidrug efflux MFS transporter periplasmic adaptor subunit EmrA [Brenneria goodwinii]MCG8171443.1 multidrug efflux MFS transporter periplasmic adaptor subunit EmrA [Brenneria goodwinii]MCG81751
MSANADTQATQQTLKNKKKTRKVAMLLLTGIFIIIAIAYLFYWLLVLRHFESTDDAYVAGNQIQIMAQVSGSVTDVNFDSTDLVKKGDVLVSIDPTDAEQAFERAKTALANSVRQTHQLIITGKQYQANIALRQTQWQQAQTDLKRRVTLGNVDAIGREELQHARDAVETAKAQYDVAVQQYNANQAMVLNTPVAQQPQVLQAAAQVRDAWLALQRTKIRSPIDGFVSRRAVQIGQRITPSTSLIAVVPAHHIWVDANFKETQLENIRIGQRVTVVSDMYGDNVKYSGKVVGMDMGTGSAFSLLPAQNATGNWIKVVQRLPVRIELNDRDVAQHPLRIGLSALVTVDTQNRDGLVLANTVRTEPLYQTSALTLDLAPVNAIIADVIHANAG